MKRNFLRHICFALIAILLVTFTATAAVLQPEDEGAHRVKVKVYIKQGNKQKSAKTVLYCVCSSYKRAEYLKKRLDAAQTLYFSGDDRAIEKVLKEEEIVLKKSRGNGEFEEALVAGRGVVVFHQDYGAVAVEVKEGQTLIPAVLVSKDQILDDTVVFGSYGDNGPSVTTESPIDLGDTVNFPVGFEIPAGLVTDKSRIICQPMAVDCQTEDTLAYLKPIILESADYHKKQDKRMGFDYQQNDSVARGYDSSYVLKSNKKVKYKTRVPYKKPNKDKNYRGCFRVVLEDYHHVIWDSGDLPTGSCLAFKPLKFLDLSVAAADMELTDEFMEPAEENTVPMSRDLPLRFEQGKDILTNDSLNTVIQNNIVAELKSYGDQLWSVSVQGSSSPEGSVERNTLLANKRADYARRFLNSKIKNGVPIATLEPRLYTWEDFLVEVQKLANQEMYDQVKAIVDANPNNAGYKMLKDLPYWSTHLEPIFERERVMVCKYKYLRKHIMTADEVVETYFAEKPDYVSGKKTLSNGDYFNLFANVTDPLELDTITMLAYKHITSQSDYTSFRLAPYVANRMALIASRNGMPDVNILKPFIDMRKPVNTWDKSDAMNPVKLNREQIILNQAVMCLQEEKLDSALLFVGMLEKKNVQEEATKRMRKLVVFQKGYSAYLEGQITNQKQIDDIKEAERYILNSGDFNRAIIWTELHAQLGKSREECERLIDRMPDDNPKKWYLKGIIWAGEVGKEPDVEGYAAISSDGFRKLSDEEEFELMRTDPVKFEEYNKKLDEYNAKLENDADQIDTSKVPFFLAYFQHSFDMEKKFIRYYRNEANVNEKIRKEYKYSRKDIPAYRQKFEMIKAYHDQQIAEETGTGLNEENTQEQNSSDNSEAAAPSEDNK